MLNLFRTSKIKYSVGIMVGAMIFFVAYHTPALALTISPIRIELSADPGQTLHSSFKIFSENSQPKLYYIKVAKFETKDETGEPAFVPGEDGLPSWVSIPKTILAPPKEYQEIPFDITVPMGVDPGGYFAAIFVSTVPVEDSDLSQIKLNSDVGTLLLFRVNGQFTEGETILDFNSSRHWYTSLPVEFSYRFQNIGQDRAKPLGDITIKNLFGGTTKLVNANSSAGNTLPRSIRRYQSAWISSGGGKAENSLGPVEYLQKDANWWQTIKWEWQHFALGRYTADLQITVNNNSARSYSTQTSFWVIPWQLLLTILGGLIVLFGSATLFAFLIIWYVFGKRKKVDN